MELIQFVQIKEGSSNLNDIFGSCKKSGLIKPSRAHGKDGNSYKMQINANDMRVRILENQLEVRILAFRGTQRRGK